MSPISRLKVLLVAAVASAACLSAAASASAAGIVNGDFETGNLMGWNTYSQSGAGFWFPYTAAVATEEGWFPPPQGNWAAGNLEEDPDTTALYQDVALPPYSTNVLSLTAYYVSHAPIVAANTLTSEGAAPPAFENQQLRIDVIKPTASIETLNPEDILATLFANKTGDPQVMAPRTVSADVTQFDGQTVRLRIVNAVHDNEFNSGIDSVSLASTLINTFTLGKLTKKNGSATVALTVPGPGTLKLISVGKKGKPMPIKALTKHPAAPGKVKLSLKPTSWGKKKLEETGKLPFRVQLTYTPTGGTPTSQTLSGKLKLTGKH
jgi:hypothetical protein